MYEAVRKPHCRDTTFTQCKTLRPRKQGFNLIFTVPSRLRIKRACLPIIDIFCREIKEFLADRLVLASILPVGPKKTISGSRAAAAVRANLRIDRGQVKIFVVAAVGRGDSPTAIVAAVLPGVDG